MPIEVRLATLSSRRVAPSEERPAHDWGDNLRTTPPTNELLPDDVLLSRYPESLHSPSLCAPIGIHKPPKMCNLLENYWTAPAPLRQTGYRHHTGLFMFHKKAANSLRSIPNHQIPESAQTPAPRFALARSSRRRNHPQKELSADRSGRIAAHRCSSFFAEAAVLVLVLALLDRFMLKGRMELNWVVSAFTISVALLAASVLTEFSSRRLAPASLIQTSKLIGFAA
jgi:hypothetical protein